MLRYPFWIRPQVLRPAARSGWLHVTGHRLALSAATVGILATLVWKHGRGAQGAKLQPDLSVAWDSVELCPGPWMCPGRYRNLCCVCLLCAPVSAGL